MKKMSILLTGVVLVVGTFILFMVSFTNQQIEESYASNQPFIQVSDNLKFKTTRAHLWFEEYIAGDNSIDPEKDVIAQLTASQHILDGILKGTKTELGSFHTIEDADIRLTVGETIGNITLLESFTRERWKNKLERNTSHTTDSLGKAIIRASTGEEAGGQLDEKFDAAYEKIQNSLDTLKNQVSQKVEKDIQATKSLALFVLAMLGGLFAALAFIMFKMQTRTEKITLEQAAKMKEEKTRLEQMTAFADAIGQGNYDSSMAMETKETDSLATALVNMKDKLRRVAEEDKKRNWVNEGLAKMSDILRKNQDTEEVYTDIVSFVVKYVGVNQGGLFVINTDQSQDTFLELKSCLAFDKKKYISKRIEVGEGLVGRCVQEKEAIYLTEIPNSYISITSGLGAANPTCLLLMPLKVNEQIFGVLELASFTTLESYQIDFIAKIAESIGAAISTVDTNKHTKQLLEKAQQQAEELRAQEEEMRQNMEELTATQEEMRRKEKEYLLLINKLPAEESTSTDIYQE